MTQRHRQEQQHQPELLGRNHDRHSGLLWSEPRLDGTGRLGPLPPSASALVDVPDGSPARIDQSDKCQVNPADMPGCWGKQGFANRGEALAHLRRLAKRRNGKRRPIKTATHCSGGVDAYRCPHCRQWHIGNARRPS